MKVSEWNSERLGATGTFLWKTLKGTVVLKLAELQNYQKRVFLLVYILVYGNFIKITYSEEQSSSLKEQMRQTGRSQNQV